MAAVLVADPDGRYLDGTDEALAIFGVTLEELRARGIGAFSGPHRELARTVWRRLASIGAPVPTGESTAYRPDGSTIRVRYVRIEPRADGNYELELVVATAGDDEREAPPAADNPSAVLAEWRAAERDAAAGGDLAADGDGAARGAEGLKELYRHSVEHKARKVASGS
jgi:PAS domain S-box-containing protein